MQALYSSSAELSTYSIRIHLVQAQTSMPRWPRRPCHVFFFKAPLEKAHENPAKMVL